MKNKFNSAFPIAISTLAASVAAVVMRILLTNFYIDPNYGVYERGTILPTIFHILLTVLSAAFIIAAFLNKKRFAEYPIPSVSDTVIFTSCISAFMLAAVSLLSLYNIVIMKNKAEVFDILMIVFSVPAIIFFLALLRQKKSNSAAFAVMSFFPTGWCAAYLIKVYFDTSLLTTSPGKILRQLALLAAMIYFLNEARFLIGKSSNLLLSASAPVAVLLLLTSSVPELILSKKLLIGRSDSFICCAAECAFGLFILSRLFTFSTISDKPQLNNEAPEKE